MTVARSHTVVFVRSESEIRPTPEQATALTGSIVTIGRAPTSTIVIPDSHVNKTHAVVVVATAERGVLVVDANSANGTRVGTVVQQVHSVAPGGEFRIGPCTFTVE